MTALSGYGVGSCKIDKTVDGHNIAIGRPAGNQSHRGQSCIRLDVEVGVIQENRLNEQRSLLVLCPSYEVGIQILRSDTTTTIALEGFSVPAKSLGSLAGKAHTWLDEQIALRGPAKFKLQQIAARTKCGKNGRCGNSVSHAHLMKCHLVVDRIGLAWPI